MPVSPVPEGYTTATPYLIVKGAAAAIDFYTNAFGATEVMRFPMPDGKIAHAELQIGNSRIMLADEHPTAGIAARNRSADPGPGSCCMSSRSIRCSIARSKRARKASSR